MNKLDIVIPVLNEVKNLPELLSRIKLSLAKIKAPYGIIIVDDHSTDGTLEVLKKLSIKYPITILTKQGREGKAYSILEGIDESTAEFIAMIDGDLQYSPEYIPEMLAKIEKEGHGVVIAERKVHHESRIRKFISALGHFVYAKLLLGLNSDTQSGLKVFKRSMVKHLNKKDVKPWAFDLPLLHVADQLGESMGAVDIDFEERKNGVSKINFVKTTWQIVTTAAKLKWGAKKVYHLTPDSEDSMVGAGVIYKKKKFVTHTTLNHSKSALITFTGIQKFVIIAVFLALVTGLFINAQLTMIIFIAILSAVYFADVFFGLFLVLKSLHFPPELAFSESRLKRIKDEYLPVYTILSPLYKEAHILPQFIKNIENLDWPKNKLDVILLLEEDDKESIEAAKNMDLPSYFRTLVVPDSLPKTKPKACNYGLAHAKGEFVVVYDAEDMPEPEQLKKAFLGFMDSPLNVFCLQAKLNYYNPNQNLLTRLFTAEYSLWFDVVLPGLQAIGTSIPLGGTSNHFRLAELKKIEGWDPFNVAEDADLGARLFRAGYKTAIIDSITLEEANSDVKNWIRQRSRWLKGYIQTYFVQMREPIKFAREQKHHYLIFQLVSGLRVTFMLINPFLWAMTASYFLLFKYVGPQIEALFPTQVFYMAGFSAVFGNFLYLYYYMIGAAKREEWGIIKYVFLVPFYWLLTSIGAFMAFYQLIFKPHFWEKTIHGLSKVTAKEEEVIKQIEFGMFRNLGFSGVARLKLFTKSTYFSGAFLIAASMFVNVLNFIYNAYLSRRANLEDFGLISLFGSFVYILSVPISAISKTVTFKSAYLLGKYDKPIKQFWANIRKKSIIISLILAILWLILTPVLTHIFKAGSALPFVIFIPIWIIGFAGAVDGGFLTGNLFFIVSGVAIMLESAVKLAFTFLFVELGLTNLVYLATPISMVFSFFFVWLYILKIKNSNIEIERDQFKFPRKFFASSIANKISTIAFLSLDIVMAKIFLTPEDAGRYAILSLTGKMVYLIGSLFTGFIIPIVSREVGVGSSSNRTFYKILGVSTTASFLAFLAFGVFGKYTTPILFGPKVYSIVDYLPSYAFAIFIQTVATSIVIFHQVKGRHVFSYLGFLFSLVQIAAIAIIHRNIGDIVMALLAGGVVYLTSIVLLHVYYSQYKTLFINLIDFLGIFTIRPPLTKRITPNLSNVLIFNWRDTKHCWSGGAEVYINEIAKRLVKKGHKVTVFCGNDRKSPRNEKVDGVQIIRRGGFYTVFIWAFLYYTLSLRKYFDVIIDSENGVPFFTPLYSKKKIFLLIHHVHQDLFRIKLKPPLSWIGKFAEKVAMPIVYKNTEVITVSPSSKADILEHKITNKDPHVIYNGVDINVYKPGKKSVNPMVLYLGRLTPQKSLHVFINSVKKIINKVPNVEIVIAGDGEARLGLIKLTKKLGLEDKINFLGKVTQEEKVSLYQKAWVFVNPSLIEGWGITTIEANACGTPVVASNVAGLRDSVKNPHSGILVPYGNVDEFSKNIIELLENKKVREQMNKDSIAWAEKFSWRKSTQELEKII